MTRLSRLLVAVLVPGLLFGSAAAHAQRAIQAVSPALAATVVHSYFDALRRQDAGALNAVTEGPASTDTRKMLSTLQSEAARRNVGVELEVRDLQIRPMLGAPQAPAAATQVSVRFNIAVVAKKWFFSKVARHINGNATFFVGKNQSRGDVAPPKIVGIAFAFN